MVLFNESDVWAALPSDAGPALYGGRHCCAFILQLQNQGNNTPMTLMAVELEKSLMVMVLFKLNFGKSIGCWQP